ncbi:MAG TPA: hypothetical protein PLR99_17000 [Polyangiaceae bacterium]|jgi:hypothetical protein|nr:hypothetical protein [Polyangiaceae bacterium]
MPTLSEVLTNEAKKSQVIKDCCELIDAEVKDKSGISGLAIKAGFSAVKGIKPGFVEHAVEDLLPEFARVLDPLFQDAKGASRTAHEHFSAHSAKVADALLQITDAKATRAKNTIAKGAYEKLRGTAKKNVEAAAPRLGKMIDKYT